MVSGFQPLEFDEKGQPVIRRVSELPSEKASKKCGIPRRYLLGIIILIFVVATALGLGLGLGLGNKKHHNSAPWVALLILLQAYAHMPSGSDLVILIPTARQIQNFV